MVINILLYIAIVVLWQIGGQVWKPARRYFIPIITSWYAKTKKEKKWRVGAFLGFLGLFLSMGYGENSKLMKLLKREWLVRLVYSLLIWGAVCLVNFSYWGLLALVVAFQVRAGGIKIGRYDFLFEDYFRASALALALII